MIASNGKTLFATATGLKREVGVAKAYRKLGWEMEGTHHHGGDDAWNIARILCDLLKKIRMGS